MKGLDPKRASELFRSNSKKHFKMYKAGRKWLVAGISALSGLLGLGTVSPTAAKADTKTTAAKTVDKEDVAATQTTGTIPATSQTTVTSATEKSQSTTEASTSTPSESTSTSGNENTTKNDTTSSDATGSTTSADTTQTGATSSATPAANANDTTTDTATNTTTTATETTQTDGTTSTKASTPTTENETPSANETSGSVADASESGSLSDAGSDAEELDALNFSDLANADGTLNLNGFLKMATESYGLTLDQAKTVADTTNANYKIGVADAIKDIKAALAQINLSDTSVTADAVLSGINGNQSEISKGVSTLSSLVDAYATNTDMVNNDTNQTPTWKGNSYSGGALTGTNAINYNGGYSSVTATFMAGMKSWLDKIKTTSGDADSGNADELLNATAYDSKQLSGSGSILGSSVTALATLNTLASGASSFAANTLGYSSDGTQVGDLIKTATDELRVYIKAIAPSLVNGIAKQALSDIRSIGGTIDDSDYAPANLSEAVGLNANMSSLIKTFGFSSLLDSTFLNSMYHAIRGNIQTAIESNWAKGEAQALNDFLGANSSVYGTGTQSPYQTQVTNYSESDPSQIMNTNDGKSLSLLSQATGYAWTQKVLGNVMSIASNDALGGTKKSTPDDIINQMVSKGMITATEGSELLAAAPHSFGSSSLDYVRQGTGAQKVIQSLYDAEYDAVNGAVLDYQHTPNISDA